MELAKIKIGTTVPVSLTTHKYGASADADSLPLIKAYVDGASVATFSNTFVDQDIGNGLYYYNLPFTVGNSFAAGDYVRVVAEITMGGISTTEDVLFAELTTQEVDDLNNVSVANVLTQVLAALDTAVSSPTTDSVSDLAQRASAFASEKSTKSGDAYTYYASDGTTPLFTITLGATTRTTA